MSGVGNGIFDGTYRPTNYSVSWMADEDIYQKVNGTKYLFPLNSTNSGQWGIGSIASLTTGQYDFQGIIFNNFYFESLNFQYLTGVKILQNIIYPQE